MNGNVSIEKLWQKYAEGDKEVFGDIYLHFYPDLYAYGRSISSHTEMIDGAIQELFIRLWTKPPGNVEAINQYIFVSFRNQLYRSLKNQSDYFTIHVAGIHEHIPVQGSAEEQIIENESDSEIRIQIRKALESLPRRRREAIFLKFFQNKSTREISVIMNIREEMVRNYIYKGIKGLRAHYSDQLFLLLTVQAFLASLMLGNM